MHYKNIMFISMIIAIAAMSGCSHEELTEREQTIRFSKKQLMSDY
jgi:hypothetical protein